MGSFRRYLFGRDFADADRVAVCTYTGFWFAIVDGSAIETAPQALAAATAIAL
jgi:hypothetical protein